MKKSKVLSSIQIVTVLLILLCFAVLYVGKTHSWFTAGRGQQILCEIYLDRLGVKVKQGDTLLIQAGGEQENYITLNSTPILAQAGAYSLTTISIENTDLSDLYIRYKAELVANVPKKVNSAIDFEEVKLNLTLVGNSKFILGTDGYYYYRGDSGTSCANFKAVSASTAKTATLMNGFNIVQDDAYESLNGETLRLRLTIEGADTAWVIPTT